MCKKDLKENTVVVFSSKENGKIATLLAEMEK